MHLLGTNPPGTAFGWQTSCYALFRSSLELVRGDRARPYFRGLSEAQWTSGVLASLTIASELAGWLPLHMLHLVLSGATLGLLGMLQVLRPRRTVAAAPEQTVGHSIETMAILRGDGERS